MFDFDARHKKFNEDFERTKRRMMIWGVVNFIVMAGLVSFGIWVIIKVLAFYGIV